ncbi:enoyl-CoA hydratase/isomerase family protein [Thermodesulfobacteriota bacterium]
MNYQTIILDKKDGVATITLNRPERLNAITLQLLDEFEHALLETRADDDVNVIVITGAGRGFCAGEDIKEAPQTDTAQKVSTKRGVLAVEAQVTFPVVMRGMPKPIIAAVNGPAVGQGFAITLACDMRIASENAKFGAFWVRRGIPPESGGAFNLPRIIGAAKAFELCFTGKLVEAIEAKEIGLVNHVVPAEDLMSFTMELAKTMAQGPPIAIGATKQLIYHGLETENMTSFLEREIFALSHCFQTEDRLEGLNAFLEKREAKFKGK